MKICIYLLCFFSTAFGAVGTRMRFEQGPISKSRVHCMNELIRILGITFILRGLQHTVACILNLFLVYLYVTFTAKSQLEILFRCLNTCVRQCRQ